MASSPTTAPTYARGAEWFSQAGLPELDLPDMRAYVRRLVRYISDPSTVRVRTLEAFGRAPPLAQIRNQRAAWVAEVEGRKAMHAPPPDDEKPDADEIFAALAERIVRGEVDQHTPKILGMAQPPAGEGDGEPRTAPMTQLEVLQACARRSGVTVAEMIGRGRKPRIVRARQFAATVLRARGNSYPAVGRYLGGRDHSTMMHAVDTFFSVGVRDPAYVAAWLAEAPCVAKMARSRRELDMLMVARP